MVTDSRLHVSAILTPHEERRLRTLIHQYLPQSLGAVRHAKLLDDLFAATAKARKVPDLHKAALQNVKAIQQVADKLYGRGRRRKNIAPPDISPNTWQPQVSRRGNVGRPTDLWAQVLMWDIKRALDDAGVPNYWKTNTPTRLVEIFRACAQVAGCDVPEEPRRAWEHAKDIKPIPMMMGLPPPGERSHAKKR
jgi:hypothetical protein